MTQYLVIWFYVANFGSNVIEANSPQQALDKHAFGRRKDIKFIIVPYKYAHFANGAMNLN